MMDFIFHLFLSYFYFIFIRVNTRKLNGVLSTKYLPYICWLIVCAIMDLAYSKEYMLAIRLLYDKYLYPSV